MFCNASLGMLICCEYMLYSYLILKEFKFYVSLIRKGQSINKINKKCAKK